MIAKPSIAFNDFSGSAKDVTARSSKGRTILSCKSYSGSIITPAQAVSRNSLSKISRAYKQLSESQMKSWESLALHLNSKPSLSYSIKLTAHNAFIRINSNRQMLGQSLLTDAPDYLHNIPTVTYDNILITTKRVLISGIQNTSDDLKLVVKMSAGQSPGVSSAWNTTVLITPGISDDWGDAALTKLYNSKIGFLPKEGEKVFIELCWIDPDSGMTGQPERAISVCTSEAQAEAEGFVERQQITVDMLTNEKQNVLDMDFEVLDGTAQVVAEGSFDIHGYGSYFYETLKEASENIITGSSMVFSRASSRPDFKPGIMSISYDYKWVDGVKLQEISVAHRAGGYDSKCEIFGSNPLMSQNI